MRADTDRTTFGARCGRQTQSTEPVRVWIRDCPFGMGVVFGRYLHFHHLSKATGSGCFIYLCVICRTGPLRRKCSQYSASCRVKKLVGLSWSIGPEIEQALPRGDRQSGGRAHRGRFSADGEEDEQKQQEAHHIHRHQGRRPEHETQKSHLPGQLKSCAFESSQCSEKTCSVKRLMGNSTHTCKIENCVAQINISNSSEQPTCERNIVSRTRQNCKENEKHKSAALI